MLTGSLKVMRAALGDAIWVLGLRWGVLLPVVCGSTELVVLVFFKERWVYFCGLRVGGMTC